MIETSSNNIKKLFKISNIKRISFRHDINGLRSIAVISVVLYDADIVILNGGHMEGK